MKISIRLLVLFFLGIGSISANAQTHHVLVEASRNATSFRFLDSTETLDEGFKPVYSTSLAVGYQFAMQQGIYFNSKIGLRNAGAVYNYDDYNYTWDMSYAEFRLGVGYGYQLGKINVHFAAQGYAARMIKAEQRLHNGYRDMIEAETFELMDYGVFFSPGMEYGLSESVKCYMDVNYMMGLYNLEKDPDQITRNRLVGVGLGLNILI